MKPKNYIVRDLDYEEGNKENVAQNTARVSYDQNYSRSQIIERQTDIKEFEKLQREVEALRKEKEDLSLRL
jgi:hypothetical protein